MVLLVAAAGGLPANTRAARSPPAAGGIADGRPPGIVVGMDDLRLPDRRVGRIRLSPGAMPASSSTFRAATRWLRASSVFTMENGLVERRPHPARSAA